MRKQIADSFNPIVSEIILILNQISHQIKDDNKAVMIMIDGPAGVGKSTFSSYLYEQLKNHAPGGLSTTFLPQDLFGLSRTSRTQLDVHPCSDAARDAELFDKLADLIDRKTIVVPKYDSLTGAREKNVDTIQPADLIVYEGVSSLGFFYPYMKYQDQAVIRIFVQPESDEALKKSRKYRDMTERGGMSEEVFEKNWENSTAHNWIYTYRGRNQANLIVTREAQTSGKTVRFHLSQVRPVEYKGRALSLSSSVEDASSKRQFWQKERAEKLQQSPQKEVYQSARKPVHSRKIPGKETSLQNVHASVYQKFGLGAVVNMIGNMKKPIKRDNPTYKPVITEGKSSFIKLVLDKSRPKNTFNPVPRFAFPGNGVECDESVILNIIEPGTDENHKMFGLSNLELVLVSEKAICEYLSAESISEIDRVIDYQRQLKKFYDTRYYFKFEACGQQIAALQPTSPYFEKQVLFTDLRGKVPSYLEEKNRLLQSLPSVSTQKHHHRFWESSDADEFLMRRRELTIEEAKQVRNNIIEKVKEIKGTRSQTNAPLMLELIKTLSPGDILGQNSPSAITDKHVLHIQCFKQCYSGELPVFKSKRQEVTVVPKGQCYKLDYPAQAFLFEFDEVDQETIEFIKNIQDKFLSQNLPDSEKSDIALIARKNDKDNVEMVFMLRKDLHYHPKLAAKTAQEVLIPADEASAAVFNKRPGFLEMAGCFLQENERAYEILTDDMIKDMLSEYSAEEKSARLFRTIVENAAGSFCQNRTVQSPK
ncbi:MULTISPECIES: uridine kinase [unclassified Legionella]|uniref:uridine kinase family protein n=1 Tax=unclassified Legionella TaxID=2622702 RepID=UPI00105684EF|nr:MULTISPECIES: hypothetical protein [unclassified Legionella]MDI9819073.1 hypothetical protein [Legionella sp. PL877]